MSGWKAQFVAPDQDFGGAPLLRAEFELDGARGAPVGATLFVSALGLVEAWVNAQLVSEDLFTPGWTSYEHRVRYAESDVSALVSGSTVIGLALGNGWYRGRLGWADTSRLYGQELAGFGELRVRYRDGTEQVFGTDTTWRAGASGTTQNDFYDGQTIHAGRRDPRWSSAGHDTDGWGSVHAVDVDLAKLVPYGSPAVRRHEVLAPRRIWTSPRGSLLVDFGQNLAGWARVRVSGEKGAIITLRHAEVLDEHGELATRPLRTARATDHFVLGGGVDEFEPTMTYHGFRYIEIRGWPGGERVMRTAGGLYAVVVGSDLRPTGSFSCSNELLNRLHSNVVWSTKGNFVSIPTDCPQRDERLGWTGDISVFAPSAAYLFDTKDFLSDWMVDLAFEMKAHGDVVPIVVPDVLKLLPKTPDQAPVGATAIWGDAAVWVPWSLWTAYGDRGVLTDNLDVMVRHGRRVRSLLSPNKLWDSGFQFGDWLDPNAPPDDPGAGRADRYVIATMCAFRTASLLAQVGDILGLPLLAVEFNTMADLVRTGFLAHYVSPDGLIESDAPAVYALAISFGLLDYVARVDAGSRLAALVAENGYRICTGFAGTPFICDALTMTGHVDVAYRLLLQTESPSWLYPVTMGATTVWERWDSLLPDGTLNPGGMTSFNHYAFGSVVDWMHRVIGGLRPLEPGYRRLLIAPLPVGGLTWAKTGLETPHGPADVAWELRDGHLHLDIRTPPQAVLMLPDMPVETLEPGSHRRAVPYVA